jgi:DNA-binding transcriptional LysR family regulator
MFLAVAESLHFGRAAEPLHLAQPYLSHTGRALEEELGAPLFLRTTRKVELTPAGIALLEPARLILASCD